MTRRTLPGHGDCPDCDGHEHHFYDGLPTCKHCDAQRPGAAVMPQEVSAGFDRAIDSTRKLYASITAAVLAHVEMHAVCAGMSVAEAQAAAYADVATSLERAAAHLRSGDVWRGDA